MQPCLQTFLSYINAPTPTKVQAMGSARQIAKQSVSFNLSIFKLNDYSNYKLFEVS